MACNDDSPSHGSPTTSTGGQISTGGEGGKIEPEGWDALLPGLDERGDTEPCLVTMMAAPPEKLSDTGCFEGTPLKPISGLVPYNVNSPLWSDAAEKDRYLALPEGAVLEVTSRGDLVLPMGALAIKLFYLDGRPLEARFVVQTAEESLKAFSYALDEDLAEGTLALEGTTMNWGANSWTVPSAEDCLDCHTDDDAPTIGLELGQLHRELLYPSTDRVANQLATLAAVGMLDLEDLDEPDEIEALPDPLDDGPIEARARSYLHANCAHCHNPSGKGSGMLDLRYSVSFLGLSACNEFPEWGQPPLDTGGEGGGPGHQSVIIAPGEPDRSLLLSRISSVNSVWQMPPLARDVVDEDAVLLIEEWIRQMESCD